jgi:hypothetical protein
VGNVKDGFSTVESIQEWFNDDGVMMAMMVGLLTLRKFSGTCCLSVYVPA